MRRKVLVEPINELADGVLSDWRWTADDLSVQVLGMVLYGLADATAQKTRLGVNEIDAAVLECLTQKVGAAPKWSGGLVAEANASAHDKSYHIGQYELIEVGRAYCDETNQQAMVDNVMANIQSVRARAGLPEPLVAVFLNPLAMLLAAREKQKGSPLTEAEVLEVRDTAACMQMTLSRAEQFYASLDAQIDVPRLNPERVWQQWKAIREDVTWPPAE